MPKPMLEHVILNTKAEGFVNIAISVITWQRELSIILPTGLIMVSIFNISKKINYLGLRELSQTLHHIKATFFYCDKR